jgi:predicted PurR-regulated permease PerM
LQGAVDKGGIELAATTHNGWQRTFLVLGSCILVTAGLYLAQKVLIPIVLAILLTFILSPLVSWLQRRGLGRIPSSIIVVFLASALLAGIGWMMLAQVTNLIEELPRHKEQIVQKIRNLREASRDSWVEDVQSSMQDLVEKIKAEVSGTERQATGPPWSFHFEAPGLFNLLLSTASPIIETGLYGLLVVILVTFMLIHREALRNRIIRLWSHGSITSMTKAIDEGTRRISRFLLMQLIVNVAQGTCLGIGLFFIGVPYASLSGFLAAVLRYVPYIGIWIAMLLPLLLSATILPSWGAPLLVLGLFIVVELVNANVVEPLVYCQSIGVSEVALLISAAFWAWLWGPAGLVLSAPLTACLAVLGRYVPGLEFLSILLGDEAVLKRHVTWYQRLIARDDHEAMEVIDQYRHDHGVEEVCENVLLPALVLTRQNREHGELTADDEEFILQATQEAIDELFPPAEPAETGAPAADDSEPGRPATAAPVPVLGCPARDKLDELALVMFKNLLPRHLCRFEIAPVGLLPAENVNSVQERQASLVLIATLSASGIPHMRYLCKCLRSRLPDVKILVGCWGCRDLLERGRRRLEYAGVDHIGTTLTQTRQQLIPLAQFLENVAGPETDRDKPRRRKAQTAGAVDT